MNARAAPQSDEPAELPKAADIGNRCLGPRQLVTAANLISVNCVRCYYCNSRRVLLLAGSNTFAEIDTATFYRSNPGRRIQPVQGNRVQRSSCRGVHRITGTARHQPVVVQCSTGHSGGRCTGSGAVVGQTLNRIQEPPPRLVRAMSAFSTLTLPTNSPRSSAITSSDLDVFNHFVEATPCKFGTITGTAHRGRSQWRAVHLVCDQNF